MRRASATIMAAALALTLALTLASCGVEAEKSGTPPERSAGGDSAGGDSAGGPSPASTTDRAGSGPSSEDTGSDGGFSYGSDFIEKNLPPSFRIVYEITTFDEDGKSTSRIEQIKAPEGYLYDADGYGMLFIYNGKDYDVYSEDGGKYIETGITYPKDTAEMFMYMIGVYMTMYTGYDAIMEGNGSAVVAGRDCERFLVDYSFPGMGYTYKYEYYIDKKTGVCLKHDILIEGGGEKAGYEFVCLVFETEGVTLPSYG